ncbi:HAD family phosphatase [Gemella sp. GH3]|nr:HAD family phosphatase [Gemella sp. GH3.1]NYS50072.1 HAD family phosphatase [Gemella sp. GH3]
MKRVDAVIFDYDGTIVDTEKLYFQVMSDLVRKYTGRELEKLGYIYNVSGTSVERCREYITSEYNMEEKIYDKLEREVAVEMADRIINAEILPYIEETFIFLKENNIKIGVASNGTLEHIIDGLKKHDLYRYVDDIVTKYDVERGKPHPDIYLMSAERLGVNIENCIAVEDSRPGALAASKSGAYLILQTNDITKHLDFTDVDYKIKNCNLLEEVKKKVLNNLK